MKSLSRSLNTRIIAPKGMQRWVPIQPNLQDWLNEFDNP